MQVLLDLELQVAKQVNFEGAVETARAGSAWRWWFQRGVGTLNVRQSLNPQGNLLCFYKTVGGAGGSRCELVAAGGARAPSHPKAPFLSAWPQRSSPHLGNIDP